MHFASPVEYHPSDIGRGGTDGPMTATGFLLSNNLLLSTDPT